MLNYLRTITGPALLVLALFTPYSHAAAPELIERYECEACHGDGGVSRHSDIPTIAGIPEFNLFDQMLSYQEGRPAATVNHLSGDTNKSGDMATIARALSEQDIEQLAAYYGRLEFIRAQQTFDTALAAQGKRVHEKNCESCHVNGGSDPYDEASILAGQQKGYLVSMLEQFYNGQRHVDKKMDLAIKKLTPADLKALAEYYASIQ